jgi:hypothetical protein
MTQSMKLICGLLASALFTLAQPHTVSAALLGVGIDIPRITFDNQGMLNYDSGTGLLSIDATPIFYQDPVPDIFVFSAGGTVSIDIEVDSTGALVGGILGDDLVVTGDVDTYSGTLLTADVSQFGFFDSGGTSDSYDFLFTITGGALASVFGGTGADLAVVVDSEQSNFSGVFTSDFSGEAKGTMGPPTVPPSAVPVPAAAWLFGSGLLGLVGIARRKKARG